MLTCRNCADDCTRLTSTLLRHVAKKTGAPCEYVVCCWCIANNTHYGDYFCNMCFSWIAPAGRALDGRNLRRDASGAEIAPAMIMKVPELVRPGAQDDLDEERGIFTSIFSISKLRKTIFF